MPFSTHNKIILSYFSFCDSFTDKTLHRSKNAKTSLCRRFLLNRDEGRKAKAKVVEKARGAATDSETDCSVLPIEVYKHKGIKDRSHTSVTISVCTRKSWHIY